MTCLLLLLRALVTLELDVQAALGSGDGAIAADGEASLVEEEVEDE